MSNSLGIFEELDYDDVLLLPTLSDINSRTWVDLHSPLRGCIGDKSLLPIISSPMKGISGVKLVSAMSDCGALGILHRFMSLEDRLDAINTLHTDGKEFGVAVGISQEDIKFAVEAQQLGATLICVDVANGYLESVRSFVSNLKLALEQTPTNHYTHIMAGNVVTFEGALALYNAGATLIRVGIGSGNLCLTRETTGVGRPQLAALEDCSKLNRFNQALIVSDGGINSPARAVKSFVFGAKLVMLGSLLGYAEEADHNGVIYGMASKKLQEEFYGKVKSVEGREQEIKAEERRPVRDIIQEFAYGIQSACTYLNCNYYDDLGNNYVSFVKIGNGTLK